MIKKAGCLTLVVLLLSLPWMVAFAAPGTGRLPWSDYQKLLRFQVMAPGVTAPEQEYMLHTRGPLTTEQQQELEQLGITLIAAVGDTVVVRGPITSFSGLGPDDTTLPWVESVTSQLELSVSGNQTYYWIRTSQLLDQTGVAQLHALGIKGRGVNVGVIDTGFTGDLGTRLGLQHVHYLQVKYQDPDQLAGPYIDEGFNVGKHGEACSEAIASVAPEATFYLMSAPTYVDRKALLQFIADGALSIGGEKVDINVLSDSTYYGVPQDHNDGHGELAVLGDGVVSSGVPYFYALGNFAQGEETDRSFYESVFADNDGDKAHDFTPRSSNTLDRNTLKIDVDRNTLKIDVQPWEGDAPVYLQVFLEWNGWPHDVQETPGTWSQRALIKVQDIDMYLSYMTPQGQVIPLPSVKSEYNQFEALDGQHNWYIPPLEGMDLELDRPGTYLVTVKNNTMEHIPAFRDRGINTDLLVERAVDLHMYVYTSGSLKTAAPLFTLEHHTAEGSIVNMGGAHDVIGVGAVGHTDDGWCVMPYSSRGPTSDGRLKPELVAPTLYETAAFGGAPPYFGGTSASAPIMTGIAVLLLQTDPTLTPGRLKEVLTSSATSLCGSGNCNGSCLSESNTAARNNTVGYGIVDALKAYRAIKH
jgi:subtilisin family serine protease